MEKKVLGLRVLFTHGFLPYTITAGVPAIFNDYLTRKMGFN